MIEIRDLPVVTPPRGYPPVRAIRERKDPPTRTPPRKVPDPSREPEEKPEQIDTFV